MIFPFTVTRLVYCNVYDVFPNNVYTVTNTAPFARLILTVKGKKKVKVVFILRNIRSVGPLKALYTFFT